MRTSYSKISWFFAAIMMAASVLSSFEPISPIDRPDQEQETPGGNEGNGNEDTPGGGDNPGGEENPGGGDNPGGGENPEPEVPVNADVIESAVLTFAYYDMIGDIDVESRRVDFYMETYGDDAPNLRYVPVVFTTKDGYKVKGTDREFIRLILTPEDQPARVTFEKDGVQVDYEVYLDLQYKEVPPTPFEFHRGVNLSYWFQDAIPWHDDQTIEEISYYGFDHVRIPFDSQIMFNKDGSVIRANMDLLHYVVRKCMEKGLNVILDMHWLVNGNLFYEEPAAVELVNNWNKLIKEFSKYPVDRVAYEILNEPHGYGWLGMQRNMLHMIRHYEPSRVIFISPQGFHPDSAVDFDIHEGDPNLVVTFHYYDPMLASHKLLWKYTGPSHYPGYLFSDEEWEAMSDANKAIAEGHRGVYYDYNHAYSTFKAVVDNQNLKHLRLHCGEFGYSHRNDREERLQWFRDVVKVFNELDIAYTTWENWGGDFGPGDWQSRPDEEVIDILMQRE